MAEIRPDQYQNGDKQKNVEIKRDVKLYFTKSYVMAVFLCISMFNTLSTFSADLFDIHKFDLLFMKYYVMATVCQGDQDLTKALIEKARDLRPDWYPGGD